MAFFRYLDINKITVVLTAAQIALPILNIIARVLYKWSKKKERIKTSDLSMIYYEYSTVELLAVLMVPLLIIIPMEKILQLLGLGESEDANLLVVGTYIYRAMVLILHFGIALLLFYKLKIMEELKKYIKKHKIFYYGIFFILPINGTFVGFAVLDLNSFEGIANVLMILTLMCYFAGNMILLKPKKYNYYNRVKIKLKNGRFYTYKYENFKIEGNFVVIKIIHSGRKIKDLYYNLDCIEKIEYMVDCNIAQQYENYLQERF